MARPSSQRMLTTLVIATACMVIKPIQGELLDIIGTRPELRRIASILSTEEDNIVFVDEMGYNCSIWDGYDCYQSKKFGYTVEGALDVIFNCRNTCDGRKRRTFMATHKFYPCEDNHDYIDKHGENCKHWQGYNCLNAATFWRFNPAEQDVLVER
eukprot:m.95267 g.95267  ORF g.95267 m.95267 type:complete len:155 (+) comp26804_c0_seq4:179-643(+)